MHYDLVTPFYNTFNKVEDLLMYRDMVFFSHSRPQAISKAYNTINKSGKFQEATKSWKCLPPIHKTCIMFKTHFFKSHQELTETVELTLEKASYGQSNLI